MRFFACLALFFALLCSGCPSADEECVTSENCPTGTVCAPSGSCVALSCADSSGCPVRNYCDLDVGDCVFGCISDVDCLPSELCDAFSQRCEARRCRNTKLDCGFGEFCNQSSGACVTASDWYCKPCVSDLECGPTGANFCLSQGLDAYCGVDCSGGQECPGGYQCVRVTNGSATVGFQCIAECAALGP